MTVSALEIHIGRCGPEGETGRGGVGHGGGKGCGVLGLLELVELEEKEGWVRGGGYLKESSKQCQWLQINKDWNACKPQSDGQTRIIIKSGRRS